MPVSADRELLFGLLAFQNDFITRDALVSAFGVWTADKSRPLSRVLADRGDLRAPTATTLDALVDAHIAQHGGRTEASLAALSSIDDVVEQLRARIADHDFQASLRNLHSAGSTQSISTVYVEDAFTGAGQFVSPRVRYKRIRSHAKGNLGEVFVAHDNELHRSVALKEIQDQHADNPSSRSRFLVEAEITGGLEHPGIVPVYGLGAYPDGRPYYAMRFVKGESLADAIRRFHTEASPSIDPGARTLALQQLLRRFLDVCNAMAYAHSRGVLHRDLKPGNIMVGKYGETLVVDWGLAKMIGSSEPAGDGEERLTAPSGSGLAATSPGSVVGTPAYMSPEQARGELDALGPASDVYGLGATLYHLLTGRAAFTSADGDLTVILSRVASGQFPAPRSIASSIPRPLEAICLKAMATDVAARYSSPLTLAADLEHWLADEPVLALRESLAERAGRWTRRHKSATLSAAAALLAVSIAATTAWLLVSRALRSEQEALAAQKTALAAEQKALVAERKAREESEASKRATEKALIATTKARDDEKAVSDLLVLAFRKPDPSADGLSLKVVDALAGAESAVRGSFGSDEIKGKLFDALGQTYLGLGAASSAERVFKEALALRTAALGPDDEQTLVSRGNVGLATLELGRIDEAVMRLEALRKDAEAKLGPDHADVLATRTNLALAYFKGGRTTDAIAMAESTTKLAEKKFGARDRRTLNAKGLLALAYNAAGRTPEAIALSESTLKLRESQLGADHPETLLSRNNLALLYMNAGRNADAIALYETTSKMMEAKVGAEHPYTLLARGNLAVALCAGGRSAEGIEIQEETLRLRVAKLGPDHPDTLLGRGNLAVAYFETGRAAEATSILEPTLKSMEAKLGVDHPHTLLARQNLGEALFRGGKENEAIALLTTNVEQMDAKLGPNHPDTVKCRKNLGERLTTRGYLAEMYRVTGRTKDAIAIHESLLKGMQLVYGPDDLLTLTTRSNLSMAYHSAGRNADAIALGEPTLKACERRLGVDNPRTLQTRQNLAITYYRFGRKTDAIALIETNLKLMLAKLGPNHADTVRTRENLAAAYDDAGRTAEALVLKTANLKSMEAKLGANYPTTLTARAALAEAYKAAGRDAEAIALFEANFKTREATLGADHPDTIAARRSLAEAYADSGQFARGIELHEANLKLIESTLGADHDDAFTTRNDLGWAYSKVGDRGAVEAIFRKNLTVTRERFGPDSRRASDAMAALGSSLLTSARWAEAAAILSECLAFRQKADPQAWTTFNTRSMLGECLFRQGEFEKAEPLVLAGLAGLQARAGSIPAAGKFRLTDAAARAIDLYELWGKHDEAARWRIKLGIKPIDAMPPTPFARP